MQYSDQQIQKLAEHLHDKFCMQNHIDQCDWDYCSWTNPHYAHNRYRQNAIDLLCFVENEIKKEN